jgi:hypothetical protein
MRKRNEDEKNLLSSDNELSHPLKYANFESTKTLSRPLSTYNQAIENNDKKKVREIQSAKRQQYVLDQEMNPIINPKMHHLINNFGFAEFGQ